MLWVFLLACKQPTPTPPGSCPVADDPYAELSQGEEWVPQDGTPVQFGIPPQGGAPYAPFEIRMIGMPSSDSYTVDLSAVDDGVEIGTESYEQRFVCANVGENQGTRYTPELHMRFYGYEPPEIDGHEVEVTVTITSEDGETIEAGWTGELDWVLGPLPE